MASVFPSFLHSGPALGGFNGTFSLADWFRRCPCGGSFPPGPHASHNRRSVTCSRAFEPEFSLQCCLSLFPSCYTGFLAPCGPSSSSFCCCSRVPPCSPCPSQPFSFFLRCLATRPVALRAPRFLIAVAAALLFMLMFPLPSPAVLPECTVHGPCSPLSRVGFFPHHAAPH